MNSSSLFLSLAILTASFWGSWHCAVMCGPVASLVAQRKGLLPYHFGRAVSYVLLGALGGWLGSFFLHSQFFYVRLFSGIFFALILIGMGAHMLLTKKPLHLFQNSWLGKIYSRRTPALLLGLLSVFLPCGWLYTYVLAAVATQSATAGAMVMFLFWLGGLPALSAVSLFLKKSIQLSQTHKQMISAWVLVGAGLYSLISFYFLH